MSAHRIHLRRPWRSASAGLRPDWSRRFGRPTGLEPGDCVWLVIEGMPQAEVWLNGNRLAPVDLLVAERYDITDRLMTRNEIVIVAETGPGVEPTTGEPPAEVYLEIVSTVD
ncbi:MAG: hypothetical protein KJZ87_03220 [Thermoguttaceae bacterium]|nr:hypothetical protein [Thermoguttaceae bacterium]